LSGSAELVGYMAVAVHHKSLAGVQQQNRAGLQNRLEEGWSLSSASVQGRELLGRALEPRQVKRGNVFGLL